MAVDNNLVGDTLTLLDINLTTITLLGLLATLIAYYFYKIEYSHYWMRHGIESDPPRRQLGNIIDFFRIKSFHQRDSLLYSKYGRVFGAYEGVNPIMYISDPQYLKSILVKDFHLFSLRRYFVSGDKVVDNFLSILHSDDWKRVRTIITPTFTTGKIKGMLKNIEKCVNQSTSNFLRHAERGEIAECKNLFGNYTLDVIATVAFGTQLDSYNDPNNIFVTNVSNMSSKDMTWKTILILAFPNLGKYLRLNFFKPEFFVELTKSIIERRKRTKEIRHDFLQLMIDCLESENENSSNEGNNHSKTTENNELKTNEKRQNQKKLSEDELISQCVLFFLAGYDTTSTTLSMVCYNLALNQEAQKTLQREIDEIWKKTDDIDTTTLKDAHYLDAVVNETLRLYPPGVRLERTASENYTLGSSGLVIPKDTLVAIPIYSMHRDPEFFPNPEAFKPERFLSENIDSIDKFTYMPFGAGPRNCVARRFALTEVKLNLMYLLKEIHFDVCSQTKIPPDYYRNNLLQPKSIKLKVTKRLK